MKPTKIAIKGHKCKHCGENFGIGLYFVPKGKNKTPTCFGMIGMEYSCRVCNDRDNCYKRSVKIQDDFKKKEGMK